MDNTDQSQKLEWVKPELRRMEAGSAESQRGLTADGGEGNQGS
jgi:hypothetical protein